MLRVNEIFETVQGEATHTGRPSVFVRLQGCPVGCPWCDTKHTWETNPNDAVALATMLSKQSDSPQWANVTDAQLLAIVTGFRARHVVFTGGEPALYDLYWLTKTLNARGYSSQVETSGTHALRVHESAWVTVSPKVDMPGGFKLIMDTVKRADEIKYPVGKQRDVDRLRQLVRAVPGLPHGAIWLQPLSQNPSATRLCIETATSENWRLSAQTHKYLGVR